MAQTGPGTHKGTTEKPNNQEIQWHGTLLGHVKMWVRLQGYNNTSQRRKWKETDYKDTEKILNISERYIWERLFPKFLTLYLNIAAISKLGVMGSLDSPNWDLIIVLLVILCIKLLLWISDDDDDEVCVRLFWNDWESHSNTFCCFRLFLYL